MRKDILKLDSIPDDLVQKLSQHYNLIDINNHTEHHDKDRLTKVQVGVANGESVLNKALLQQFPGLALISIFGVGYDGVDLTYARQQGITVSNTPGVLTDDVADLAVAFSIALVREMLSANYFVARGEWSRTRYPLTARFSHMHIGIFGMGRVGKAICKRLAAFGCTISYVDRYEAEIPAIRVPDLSCLAKEVNLLILAANASEENKGIVNMDILKRLGRDGYLVNVARGNLINQPHLISALSEGVIAGAALDVLENEPNVPEQLLRDNVLLTPHYASGTRQTREAMSALVAENIDSFFNLGNLVTPVN